MINKAEQLLHGFLAWVANAPNTYEFIWSLATILMSGMISLLISWFFFYLSNRSSVKISLLFPVARALERPYKKGIYEELYKELKKLEGSYCARYLLEDERVFLDELIFACERLRLYDRHEVDAQSLLDHFIYKLEQKGVNTRTWPILDGDHNVLFYDYPPNLQEGMVPELRSAIEASARDFDDEAYRWRVATVFNRYSRLFGCDGRGSFLDNCTIEEAIENSATHKEWQSRFDALAQAKKDFLSLRALRRKSL